MAVENVLKDARTRFEKIGAGSQRALKVAVRTRREAFGVLKQNGRTLINTEIGAGKNLASAMRASARRVRKDGLRRVARNPGKYAPNGRRQIIAAVKGSVGIVWRTGGELGRVLSEGYASAAREAEPQAGGESTRTTGKSPTSEDKARASTARPRRRTTSATRRTTTTTSRASARASTSTGADTKSEASDDASGAPGTKPAVPETPAADTEAPDPTRDADPNARHDSDTTGSREPD